MRPAKSWPRRRWGGGLKIAPSILNANFLDLGSSLKAAERGGGDAVHVDVMDGHFVPNLSLGPYVVRYLRAGTRLPLDVHLMVSRPADFVGPFLDAGADGITVHVESSGPIRPLLRRIRRAGAKAGVTVRPHTPLSALRGLLGLVDMVLVMTVEPGFGGQPLKSGVLGKITELRRIVRGMKRAPDIEVDGGIRADNVGRVVAAGANVIVVGWAVFGGPDPAAALRRIRRRAVRAMAGW